MKDNFRLYTQDEVIGLMTKYANRKCLAVGVKYLGRGLVVGAIAGFAYYGYLDYKHKKLDNTITEE